MVAVEEGEELDKRGAAVLAGYGNSRLASERGQDLWHRYARIHPPDVGESARPHLHDLAGVGGVVDLKEVAIGPGVDAEVEISLAVQLDQLALVAIVLGEQLTSALAADGRTRFFQRIGHVEVPADAELGVARIMMSSGHRRAGRRRR